MKILIYSQYFWPESFLINDLAKVLRDAGHSITVATGKPNYPDGEIFPGYQALGTQRELFDSNIEVVRVPLRPRRKKGALNLFLNYLSFTFSGLFFFPFLLRGREFDVILIFAATPNVALSALPLKWIKNAHLAFWIQDLWPDSLAATGYVKSPVILKIVGWIVRFTYSCADTILVQSRAFEAPVAAYSHPKKVVYYPNSMKVEASGVTTHLPHFLEKILREKFCVVFAGNLGTAQSLETVLDAAEILRSLPHIQIVLVGSGSRLIWVEAEIAERGLINVSLAGRFPSSSMSLIFDRAECLLVSLKKDDIFAFTIPSKIQAYLAAGKPIVASLNGEGGRVILEAGAGRVAPAEDSVKLAEQIREIFDLSPAERKRMGEFGKKYFYQHFEMRSQARRLQEILASRMPKTSC